MSGFLKRLFSRFRGEDSMSGQEDLQVASSVSVAYDDQGVELFVNGELKQRIGWDGIELIAIRIEDEFLPFPYWYVGNQNDLLRIPNDASGGQELFFDGISKHVPGYRSDAAFNTIIEASSAIEGSFIVWRKENAGLS